LGLGETGGLMGYVTLRLSGEFMQFRAS
jgi:hypothetical protein